MAVNNQEDSKRRLPSLGDCAASPRRRLKQSSGLFYRRGSPNPTTPAKMTNSVSATDKPLTELFF